MDPNETFSSCNDSDYCNHLHISSATFKDIEQKTSRLAMRKTFLFVGIAVISGNKENIIQLENVNKLRVRLATVQASVRLEDFRIFGNFIRFLPKCQSHFKILLVQA